MQTNPEQIDRGMQSSPVKPDAIAAVLQYAAVGAIRSQGAQYSPELGNSWTPIDAPNIERVPFEKRMAKWIQDQVLLRVVSRLPQKATQVPANEPNLAEAGNQTLDEKPQFKEANTQFSPVASEQTEKSSVQEPSRPSSPTEDVSQYHDVADEVSNIQDVTMLLNSVVFHEQSFIVPVPEERPVTPSKISSSVSDSPVSAILSTRDPLSPPNLTSLSMTSVHFESKISIIESREPSPVPSVREIIAAGTQTTEMPNVQENPQRAQLVEMSTSPVPFSAVETHDAAVETVAIKSEESVKETSSKVESSISSVRTTYSALCKRQGYVRIQDI